MTKVLELLKKGIVSLLDPNGQLSFGRFMTLWIVANVLTWDAAYVVFSWRMNITHPELHLALIDMLPAVTTLIGQATFMTIFYGVTKWQEYKKAGLDVPADKIT